MNITTLMRWHRRIGVAVFVPVLFWCISGVLHPLMSRVKPTVVRFALPPLHLQTNDMRLSVHQALAKAHLTRVHNVRLIRLSKGIYYQFFAMADNTPIYVSAGKGSVLSNGDQAYAVYLARYFSGDGKSVIRSVDRLTDFSIEYPAIHRLLPVMRVAFDRSDGLTAFVDTASSRLGALADNKRFVFLRFFGFLHSWSFLNDFPMVAAVLAAMVSLCAMVVGVLGIIIYSNMFRKFGRDISGAGRASQWHRVAGALFSIGLLMFAFSGVWQAIGKLTPDDRQKFVDRSRIETNDFRFPLINAMHHVGLENIEDVTVADLEGMPCYRMLFRHGNQLRIAYIRTDNGSVVADGDVRYAKQLAHSFSGMTDEHIVSISRITNFDSEYGFINKRLPVFRVQYDAMDKVRLYVEISTGRLAARFTTMTAWRNLSFTDLHKWGVLDAAGKGARDFVMALFAFGNAVAIGFGGYLYFSRRLRQHLGERTVEVGKPEI